MVSIRASHRRPTVALCSGPAYAYCRYENRAMAYTLLGTAVGLASFVWSCLAPRCPTCGKRIVWWALSTKPVGRWVLVLQQLQTCPGCGDAFDKVARASPGYRGH